MMFVAGETPLRWFSHLKLSFLGILSENREN